MPTIFNRELRRVLSEMDNALPPRIAKLAQMVNQVAADFNTTLRRGSQDLPTADDPGEVNFEVVDQDGIVLWLKLVYSADGKISYYDILAAPSQGQEWDFVDMELTHPYDDFLGNVADLNLEPPAKDYGFDFLNIVAWVIHAHQQMVAAPEDLDNLYEAGYYKVRLTLNNAQQGPITLGYWVEASSSEDARQQVIDIAGNRLVGEPTVIQFSKEPVDFS